ncbi:MAG: peptidase S41 [Planctomycetes bacterium]|nr:peptidase S41 [Planctomycetota bacterium]
MNILSSLVMCAAIGCGDDPSGATLLNGDFEAGKVGEVPDGWRVPPACAQLGYTGKLTEDGTKSGKRCACIAFEGSGTPSQFGNLMQSFDASPYHGKIFTIHASVRTSATSRFAGGAQFWVRVDRPGQKMGFFDNMDDRPIASAEWKDIAITGDVSPDALRINVGLMLFGNGRAWLDDVRFDVVSDGATAIAPPRALEGRALDNLVAFTRLYGYVRYFHPSSEAASADWKAIAIQSIPKIEGANDPDELARLLEDAVRPVAPTVRIQATGKTPAKSADVGPPAGMDSPSVVSWEYHGMSVDNAAAPIYFRTLLRKPAPQGQVPEGFADPRTPFTADLGGGVSCSVPLALFEADAKTYPRPTETLPGSPAFATGNDRTTRLADVVIAWNVFQHFYPYFDTVTVDWPASLRTALASAATDRDERAFLDTLRLLVAQLKDGHGNVAHSSDSRFATPPITWDWIEDRLVITSVNTAEGGTSQFHPGDVIESIDGRKALDVLHDCERRIAGATPQYLRYRALGEAARGDVDSTLILGIRAQKGQPFTIGAKREPSKGNDSWKEPRPKNLSELRPGIRYVNLDVIGKEEFSAAVADLAQAKGIVFDLRGYPSRCGTEFLQHLTDKPIQSAYWNIPVARRPDREEWTFAESPRWNLTPLAPQFKGKIAFVTDGRAISYAESCLGIVEAYKLADIVGGPTAGTNGNVNPFTVPGGYTIRWTGMKVLKNDGSPHHGVGIKPTVPVSRTIAGVAAGRDELLEKAIEVVSKE